MPHIPSSDLFVLIKSLSKSEVSYFKNMGAKNEQNVLYKLLFNLLIKMNEYDEDYLLVNLGVNQRQLADAKHYLFQLILTTLEIREENGNNKLSKLLLQAELLFARNIFSYAEKITNKLIKLAYDREEFTYLLEGLSLLRKIQFRLYPAKKYVACLNAINTQRKEVMLKYENLLQYEYLASQMSYESRINGKSRNALHLKRLEKIHNNPLLLEVKQALSFSAKVHFYRINGVYYELIHQDKQALYVAKELTQLYQQHEIQKSINAADYLIALFNLADAYFFLHQEEKMPELIKEIKQLKFTTEKERIYGQVLRHLIELKYYTKTANYENAKKHVIDEIELFLVDFSSKIPIDDKQEILFRLSEIYFALRDLKKAKKYINEVLSISESNMERNDLYSLAKLLIVIYAYENNDENLVELTASCYNYHYYKKKLYKFEKLILLFFKRLNKLTPTDFVTNVLKELKDNLSLLANDNFEKQPLELFPFIAWLTSKIENRPFAEVVKDNYESGRKKLI